MANIGELMQAALPAGLTIETGVFPLSGVERVWSADTGNRRALIAIR
jgi:hypothetical protein